MKNTKKIKFKTVWNIIREGLLLEGDIFPSELPEQKESIKEVFKTLITAKKVEMLNLETEGLALIKKYNSINLNYPHTKEVKMYHVKADLFYSLVW